MRSASTAVRAVLIQAAKSAAQDRLRAEAAALAADGRPAALLVNEPTLLPLVMPPAPARTWGDGNVGGRLDVALFVKRLGHAGAGRRTCR